MDKVRLTLRLEPALLADIDAHLQCRRPPPARHAWLIYALEQGLVNRWENDFVELPYFGDRSRVSLLLSRPLYDAIQRKLRRLMPEPSCHTWMVAAVRRQLAEERRGVGLS